MKNTFYLLLFWLGLSLRVPAQAIWSADFPFAGELPSNEMTELYQDEDGFVWIGTTNGLSRYDGYRLQTFQTDYRHPGRLTHNHITCIAEDSAYLWIGTRKGLNLIDKRTYRITRRSSVADSPYPLSLFRREKPYMDSLERPAIGIPFPIP